MFKRLGGKKKEQETVQEASAEAPAAIPPPPPTMLPTPAGSCVKFAVHAVEPGRFLPRKTANDLREAWELLGRVEAKSALEADAVEVFSTPSLLATAVYKSFYDHYPLKLSPDAIWFTVAQGFSKFVAKNAEELRHKFVNFEGKKKLEIKRPGFVLGSPANDWPGVFPEFSSLIAENIGAETAALIEGSFSTTTVTDRLASNIVLMDTMQHYFEYSMACGCGIPSIELLGTLADWELVLAKATRLKDYSLTPESELSLWLAELLPVLEHFVQAARGTPDIAFWGSVCNLMGGSGMPGKPITGWIQVFFPYIRSDEFNRSLTEWRQAYREATAAGPDAALKAAGSRRFGDRYARGVSLDSLPSSIASAPVQYRDLPSGTIHPMTFYSGLTSLHQDPDGSLSLRSGWAVVHGDPRPSIGRAPGRVRGLHGFP
eukprot:m.148890 g.148890  ORF g.148890 m.148890 type:complete len:430 (-) comp15063_c4_seq4:1026-2315(-)